MSSYSSEFGFKGNGKTIPGLSRQPSPAAREVLLDPNDTIMLLMDHQTGLFQTVKDVPVAELRARGGAREDCRTRQSADHYDRIGAKWPERTVDAGARGCGAKRQIHCA